MIQKCPRCGSTNIQFTRENQGEVRRGKKRYIVHKTIGLCKDCGKTWDGNYREKKNSFPFGWFLLWLFLFPVALTIVLYKSNLDKRLKYGLIAGTWALCVLAFVFSGGSKKDILDDSTTEVVTETVEETDVNITEKSLEQITQPSVSHVESEMKSVVSEGTTMNEVVDDTSNVVQEEVVVTPDVSAEEIVVTNDEPMVITNNEIVVTNDDASPQVSSEHDYVINADTGVFHTPNCRVVKKMNEENKVLRHGTRAGLEAEGYVACGVCNPW